MFSKKEVPTTFEMNTRDDSTASSSKFKETKADSRPSENKCIANSSPIFLNCLGLFCASLTTIFHVTIAVITKIMPNISLIQISFFYYSGLFVGSLPIAIYYEKQILGERKHRFLLFLRGLFACASCYVIIIAYRYLPLAEAAVVISTTPVATTIIARILLKESCGILQIISLLLTIFAVLLSVRLPKMFLHRNDVQIDSSYFGGLAAAAAAVIVGAATTVIMRKLKHVHYGISNLYTGVVGTVISTIIISLASSFEYPQCGRDQILCIVLGISGFMSASCLTWAVQLQPAGIVAVEKFSLDIIVTIIFQIIFFRDYPDVYVSCSAFIVLISLTIIGFNFWLIALPEDSMSRKKLKFCLF